MNLQIFDMAGRKVRTLVSTFQDQGQQKAYWDGRNDNGQQVPPGVYVYQLNVEATAESKKLLLVR